MAKSSQAEPHATAAASAAVRFDGYAVQVSPGATKMHADAVWCEGMDD